MKITIYSKKECHLCDEAKAILRKFSSLYPIEILEIDIEQDRDSFEKYKEEIPVIFLDEKKLFKYRIEETKLKTALENKLRTEKIRGI